MRSIKAKLLLQSMASVLIVALLGMLSATWVAVTDHRARARMALDAALSHVTEDLDQLAQTMAQTAESEAHAPPVLQVATHLYQLNTQGLGNAGVDMRTSLRIKAIEYLQHTANNRGLSLVAFYDTKTIVAYAAGDKIRLVTQTAQNGFRHLAPTGPSALVRFGSTLWQPVPPNPSIPLFSADLPSKGSRFISPDEGQLALEAAALLTVKVPSADSYEDMTEDVGAILLRADLRTFLHHITLDSPNITIDLFTGDGHAMTAGSPAGHALLPNLVAMNGAVGGVLLDADGADRPSYALLRPYRHNGNIIAWLAAFTPKATIVAETRKIVLLQSLGLLVGLTIAAAVAVVMGRILSRPIIAVAQEMRDIAATQDFGRQVTVDGHDEVATLARAFNEMSAELDITTRAMRQAEAKYRGIFENAADGMFQTSLDGRLVTGNPALARMFGYQTQDEMFAANANINEVTYVRATDRAHLVATLQRMGRVTDYEVDLKRKDGTIFRASIRAHLIYPSAQNERLIEGSVRDISARQEKEKAVQARRAAEAATRAKSTFLAHMSHEIRTPLNAITGMSRALTRSGSSPDLCRTQAAKILRASQILEKILNDILDISKIEAGRMVLESVPFRLDDILQGVMDLISMQASEKGLRVSVHVDDDVPQALQGDPLRLGQVLTNLVTNAVKFTQKGQIDIRVCCAEAQETVVRLSFMIKDTGIGISPDLQSSLFEPFAQADTSTTRRFGGSGLGLAICRHIVGLMGGTIGVSSRPGQGSTFQFSVWLDRLTNPPTAGALEPRPPLEDRQQATDEAPPARQSGLTQADVYAPLRGARILLVEDNPFNQEVACALLTDVGMIVDVATDGEKGVAMGQNGRYDAVLMDLQMPVMDGYTATAQLRADPRLARLPIIAMTAHALFENRERCLQAGITDYVPKPVDPDRLYSVLMTWIHRRDETLSLPGSAPDSPLPASAPPDAPIPPTFSPPTFGPPTFGPPASRPGASSASGPGPAPSALPNLDQEVTREFDLNRALLHLNHKADRLRPLMEAFRARFANTADDITAALNAGDRAAAFRAAHALKGIAGTLGAGALEASASALADALRPASLDPSAPIDQDDSTLAVQVQNLRADLARAVFGAASYVAATSHSSFVSAGPTSPSETNAMGEPTSLEDAIIELSELLDRQGFGTRRTFASLRPRLKDMVPDQTLIAMDEALNRLDFKAARSVWSEIRSAVKTARPTPEGSS